MLKSQRRNTQVTGKKKKEKKRHMYDCKHCHPDKGNYKTLNSDTLPNIDFFGLILIVSIKFHKIVAETLTG